MDTRAKIISSAEAASRLPAGTLVVSGHFDPLLAPHAERLAAARPDAAALAVLVTEPECAILPARARAELVASLACVDFVILDAPGAPEPRIHMESQDAATAAAFIEHVRQRQN